MLSTHFIEIFTQRLNNTIYLILCFLFRIKTNILKLFFLLPDVKEGECPEIAVDMDENAIAPAGDRCDRECNTDADCSEEFKCCQRGCSLVCVKPKNHYEAAYTVQPTQYNYPPGGNIIKCLGN